MATLLDLSQKGDLLLQAAHGIDTERSTTDVDLAFLADTWDEFLGLRNKYSEHIAVPAAGRCTWLRYTMTAMLSASMDAAGMRPLTTPG
jgi:predicted nucleotidyltransferase